MIGGDIAVESAHPAYAAACTDTDTACPSAANAASSCSSREAWSSRNRRYTDSRFQIRGVITPWVIFRRGVIIPWVNLTVTGNGDLPKVIPEGRPPDPAPGKIRFRGVEKNSERKKRK
jgi:hypothetical protein